MNKVIQAMKRIPHLHVPSTTGTAGLTGAASIEAPLDPTTKVDRNFPWEILVASIGILIMVYYEP